MSLQTDVLVIGAGPAGLSAATAAAQCGRRVHVVDDSLGAGGQIWRQGVPAGKPTGDRLNRRTVQAFERSGATLLSGHRVFDAPQLGVLRCVVDEGADARAETIAFGKLILATGARERFLPFPGWTLPGVFGAGGLQALVKGGFSVRGKRVIVAGTGPLLLAVAAHLRAYGARVLCVAEQASLSTLLPFTASLWSQPRKLVQGLRLRAALARVPFRTGCWPVSAEGEDRVRSVRLTDGARTWEEPCDLLACGFHLVPNTELASLLGCRLHEGMVAVDQDQRTSIATIFCAGEPTGIAGVDAALVQGRIAGLAAAEDLRSRASLYRRRNAEQRFGRRLERTFALRPELRRLASPETIVCRCEDVCFASLEGHISWTEAKLQTRCGMGACQGRVCGPAVEALFGWSVGSIRQPIFPVPLSVLTSEPDPHPATTATALQETS